MSSLMTNTSAMTALQTLQMTNQQLDKTQNEISTGYKVASASDNAAYWSIATTMRSDNNSLSTVSDALGLGSATVNTAYMAMNSVKDTLDAIKKNIVTAMQPGVDKSKIQADIAEQLQQIKTYADGAGFSGNNWLSVNSMDGTGYNATQSIVASFTRSTDGTVSLGNIDVDITKISLFNADTTAGAHAGLLDPAGPALAGVGGLDSLTAVNAVDGTSGAGQTLGTFSSLTLDADASISFQIAVDGGSAKTVTINKGTVEAALAGATGYTAGTGTIGTADNYALVLNQALSDAGVTGASAAVDAGSITISSADTTAATSAIAISGVKSSSTLDLMSLNITNASVDDLQSYLKSVDTMFQNVTTAAADLGAVQSRISSQQTFVKSLMDSIDSGVGSLVDADMNEASTRLKALQTQQQLGIQALSIANSNSQNILSLFRS